MSAAGDKQILSGYLQVGNEKEIRKSCLKDFANGIVWCICKEINMIITT